MFRPALALVSCVFCFSGSALCAQTLLSGSSSEPNAANANLTRPTAIQQSPPDAMVHPGDLITVSVYNLPAFNVSTRLSATGDASLPLVGVLHLGGMNVAAVQDGITRALLARQILYAPQVSVFIEDSESQTVSVFGAVAHPGSLSLLHPTRLTDVISRAGGLAIDGGDVAVIRRLGGGETAYRLGLDSDDDRNAAANVMVNPGDTVSVEKANI
jgi:polysaccharide biosynthesis/export protein